MVSLNVYHVHAIKLFRKTGSFFTEVRGNRSLEYCDLEENYDGDHHKYLVFFSNQRAIGDQNDTR